ncbi:HD-GYP domain-containing protein [Wenjunlia tyrosinilytica]|uniref:Metal-dependent phosphohydrolase n=1 Tax=Wenjunlia tyrosinilytica TaxID=1544741 RepID=A0A918DWG2_9ACTN|nr:HD-GYP domain-containing protein [Wenjunlia tyrosinilytica]GGO85662.1 metal-dependent phosphohydrolase [Wenjunlia tyrosinilytica]
MRALPPAARLYVLLGAAAALGCVVPLLGTAGARTDWTAVLVLAALCVVCEQATLCRLMGRHVPTGTGAFFPVLLTGVLMLPPPAAALVAVPGALIGRPARRPALLPAAGHAGAPRRVWNAAQLAVAAAAASAVHQWAGGPRILRDAEFPRALGTAGLATLTFWLVAGALMSGVLVTASRRAPMDALRRVLVPSLAPSVAHGVVGLTMAVLWTGPYGPLAAVLALLPMYVSCWVFAQYHREQAAHHATVRALVQAVDLKDEYTRGHSERVGRASVMIGREIGIPEERIEALRFAGTLHDVGKLGVPTRLLRKSGRLTPEERGIVQRHPEYGHEMVRGIEFLEEALSAILHHHERLDGSGYPYGLSGAGIPQFARVVAVADAFDAMTSNRVYRAARPVSVAMEELRACAGSQFDPDMVNALIRAVTRQGWAVPSPADGDGTPPVPAPDAVFRDKGCLDPVCRDKCCPDPVCRDKCCRAEPLPAAPRRRP